MSLYCGPNPKIAESHRKPEKYCEEELKEVYTVEIIDLLENPHLAEGEQIIAVPTLIKKLPAPARVLVGDLSDKIKVLVGLNLVKDDPGK
ncbi:circadian clock KaiB family protein [Mucilaginibacter sp.]|jgi:circadian clock protein KaiB|uniref:circadian clock KaiB family protein n=1 Tax=Mucilaginibacter sp. TaxID=1882438 RepID=UPI003562E4DC